MNLSSHHRRAQRVSTTRPVAIMHQDTRDAGKMIDLSIIGAGIVTDAQIDENEHLCIEFVLPNFGPSLIQVQGRAIHTSKVRNQTLIGLEFEAIPPRTEAQIAEFVRYHHRLD